jgi:hypothetical protein
MLTSSSLKLIKLKYLAILKLDNKTSIVQHSTFNYHGTNVSEEPLQEQALYLAVVYAPRYLHHQKTDSSAHTATILKSCSERNYL